MRHLESGSGRTHPPEPKTRADVPGFDELQLRRLQRSGVPGPPVERPEPDLLDPAQFYS